MPDRRQARLDLAQAQGRLTSVVACVFDRYGAVWAGAAGDCPGVDGQYRIGSITKTLTAALVMQARDAGLLDLDEPIRRQLPDTGYAEATPRQLLSHTSGMQSEPAGDWWERSRGSDFPALAASNDGSGRIAAAGDGYHYSNLGYALLGELVARLTGTPWRRLVAERLLGPLGMRQTSYLPRPHAQPGWSVDHFTGVRTLEPLTDTGAMAPAGQLWSTLADLLRWGQFLAGSRPDVLAAESLREMTRPVTPSYGLGVRLTASAAGSLVGHTGTMPGFLAALFVDPVSGIGAAALSNATTGIDQERLVVDLIDGEGGDDTPEAWRPTTRLPEQVEGIPGLWFWGNSAVELGWHNGGLDARHLRPPFGPDRFELRDGELVGVEGYHRGETLHVRRRPDGTISHLECATFVYTRTPYDPEVPIPGGHPAP